VRQPHRLPRPPRAARRYQFRPPMPLLPADAAPARASRAAGAIRTSAGAAWSRRAIGNAGGSRSHVRPQPSQPACGCHRPRVEIARARRSAATNVRSCPPAAECAIMPTRRRMCDHAHSPANVRSFQPAGERAIIPTRRRFCDHAPPATDACPPAPACVRQAGRTRTPWLPNNRRSCRPRCAAAGPPGSAARCPEADRSGGARNGPMSR
jgi:hypothetical protein